MLKMPWFAGMGHPLRYPIDSTANQAISISISGPPTKSKKKTKQVTGICVKEKKQVSS